MVAHDPPSVADGLPTLDDVLSLLGPTGAGVHLDLKSQRAERPVAEALRRHGLVERTLVSSFRRETLRALHAVEPGVRLGRTYPQDRTGLTKRSSLPAAGAGDRARAAASAAAPHPVLAGPLERNRCGALLGGGQRSRP